MNAEQALNRTAQEISFHELALLNVQLQAVPNLEPKQRASAQAQFDLAQEHLHKARNAVEALRLHFGITSQSMS